MEEEMRTIVCLRAFVTAALFVLAGCGSSDNDAGGGTGSGGGIGPHGNKPSAEQEGCTEATGTRCIRYTYNTHGDLKSEELCNLVTCKEWCDYPYGKYYTYEYDAQGRIIKEMRQDIPAPSGEITCYVFTAFDDHNNWIKKAPCGVDDVSICRELTYDVQGRIQTEFGYRCETKEELGCTIYSYDSQSRIIQERRSSSGCDDLYACIKYVYEGDTVTSYSGDGNCQNMGEGYCTLYFY